MPLQRPPRTGHPAQDFFGEGDLIRIRVVADTIENAIIAEGSQFLSVRHSKALFE